MRLKLFFILAVLSGSLFLQNAQAQASSESRAQSPTDQLEGHDLEKPLREYFGHAAKPASLEKGPLQKTGDLA